LFDEVLKSTTDGYPQDWKPGAHFPVAWTGEFDYFVGSILKMENLKLLSEVWTLIN